MTARLIQETRYPEYDSSELRLQLPAPTEFVVRLRIPGWLERPAQIAVNGRSVSVAAERRTFAAIRRRCQNNDTIQVALPFSFRAEPIDDEHPRTVALMYGPLMLVALDPELRLPQGALSSPDALRPTSYAPQSFELQAGLDKLRFVPFYALKEEPYTNYVVSS
jgi:hypothetical protein